MAVIPEHRRSAPALCCAVMALKGGVGKSTTTLGLAGAAWERGLRTLVIDLDPQANTTVALDPAAPEYTVNDVLSDARHGIAAEAIVPSGWGEGLDVLASERALEHRAAAAGRDSAQRLRVSLAGVTERYDVVLVDCPPSLGELTRNALAAVQLALVVTEPAFFSLAGAEQALGAIEVVRAEANLDLRPAGILVNRVRPHTTEHAFRLAELHDAYGDLVLEPVIPERTCVQQAQGACVPIQTWRAPGAREVSDAYEDVLDTLLRRGATTALATGTDHR